MRLNPGPKPTNRKSKQADDRTQGGAEPAAGCATMALIVTNCFISSDRSRFSARLLPDSSCWWEVSYLPGLYMDHDDAVTAMELADGAGRGRSSEFLRAWNDLDMWGCATPLLSPRKVAPGTPLTAEDGIIVSGRTPTRRAASPEALWTRKGFSLREPPDVVPCQRREFYGRVQVRCVRHGVTLLPGFATGSDAGPGWPGE